MRFLKWHSPYLNSILLSRHFVNTFSTYWIWPSSNLLQQRKKRTITTNLLGTRGGVNTVTRRVDLLSSAFHLLFFLVWPTSIWAPHSQRRVSEWQKRYLGQIYHVLPISICNFALGYGILKHLPEKRWSVMCNYNQHLYKIHLLNFILLKDWCCPNLKLCRYRLQKREQK